jgi:hypothetical protein
MVEFMDLMMVASRSVDDLYPAVETHLGWEGCLILVAMFDQLLDMVPHRICNDPFPKALDNTPPFRIYPIA